MKTNDLMDAWNDIDEKYLSEAERRLKHKKKTESRKRLMILFTVGIGFGTAFLIRNFTNKPGVTAVQPGGTGAENTENMADEPGAETDISGESGAEEESGASDFPADNADPMSALPETPFDGIRFGMTAAEITAVLGPADETLGTEGVDTILHYTKSIDCSFGKTADLYLSVLEYAPDGKVLGLYRIDGSFRETDLETLDAQIQESYGMWDEVVHDENKESEARIVDGKLTYVEGLQACRYVYNKWKLSALDPERRTALENYIRTMQDSYAASYDSSPDEDDRTTGYPEMENLVSIDARGIEGKPGVAFSIDALYFLALNETE